MTGFVLAAMWAVTLGFGTPADVPDPVGPMAFPDQCRAVLPAAATFEPITGTRYCRGLDASGEPVGWVILSTDVTDLKGYSGKPLETLVGLDPNGIITGARIVRHNEPILLVGIPEEELHQFTDFYRGKHATTKVVVGRTGDPEAAQVDGISGATVTALAQNRTILDSARALGAAVGIIEGRTRLPGTFVSEDRVLTWRDMERAGVFGRLTVSQADMGAPPAAEPFMDLWFTIADAPQVGKALMAEGDYRYLMKKLAPDEHLLVVLGRGTSSFKGSGFVRGGLFDRVRLQQGLSSMFFRDRDYFNLSHVAAPDAPTFKEGAVFITRDGKLDPGEAFELVYLGSQYDGKGGFSRDFVEFKGAFRLPDSIYQVEDRPFEWGIWVQAWKNKAEGIAFLSLYLAALTWLFLRRPWLTASMRRLERIHALFLVIAFFGLGLAIHAQPSVTQILTFVGSLAGDWEWGLFLSEPLLFLSWVWILVASLIWGRGLFCGWVCPYGALNELLFKLGQKLGVKPFEFSDAVHHKLRYLRYGILLVLIAIFLYSPEAGERAAEVEPFKTTFFVIPWQRQAGYLIWWLVLLVAALFMFRPFCRYLCPLGGGLAILSSFRTSPPRRRSFCSSCKICTKGCEPRAIRPNGTIDARECLNCMECEANFHDEAVCPPLVGIAKIQGKPCMSAQDREKLEKLQQQAFEV
ncbi:4Fe-4S binding protein [Sulfidibacter corallicola]|uniref:4Fe-4S binding protein n=1 Tax=Sulfidibacter corallicola TaxID=2818388 RepID=A0A8A4TNE2_SULCO|nr:4Fe-4S binding protein [Sulfidibacter corallicola]QTD50448.1 4Fe-4S binding protein [Sulfidibacter corallicola]